MQQQQNRKKKGSERKKFCRRQYTTGKCDEWAHVNEWNLYTAMWYACSSTFRFLLFFFRDACSRRHCLLLFFLYRARVCYFSSTVEAATTTAVFRQRSSPRRQLQQPGKPRFECEKPRPLGCAWAGVEKLGTLAAFRQTLRTRGQKHCSVFHVHSRLNYRGKAKNWHPFSRSWGEKNRLFGK